MNVERRGNVIQSCLWVNPKGEELMVKTKPVFRLNDGSRMSGDVHVRFCEGLGVKFPRATLPAKSSR